MMVSSTSAASSGIAPDRNWPSRCAAWREVSWLPGFGRLSSARDRTAVTMDATVMTMAAMPRTGLGLRRMVANAPSRISPSPSGRSGMTPGLGVASP